MNLSPSQRKAIDLLAKSPLREKFYGTGGTLLSYHYLNHRKSLDIVFSVIRNFPLMRLMSVCRNSRK